MVLAKWLGTHFETGRIKANLESFGRGQFGDVLPFLDHNYCAHTMVISVF